jgi:tRNA threonylcarbamoyladenosine biosynthesis protein TsaE
MQRSTHSVDDTVTLGRALGRAAAALAHDTVLCIALDGQLGAGKTQLTRGIAEGAGVEDITLVSSPTYVLMNVYPARPNTPGATAVYHLDAYRIGGESDFEEIGFEGLLEGEEGAGLVVVEWAERVSHLLPPDRLHVRLEHAGTDADDPARLLTFEATGPRAAAVLEALRESLALRGLGGG